ncbi:MAG: hypothetical protein JWO94_951 [Verrucomicrobiaceae bacterium]|nr:hypothetical protein [Verrucomicrobiaceae bacterium]
MRILALALLFFFPGKELLRADPVVPGNILEPKTAAEAWNVIRLATDNVDRLIKENRLTEIAVQISFCSPSLRTLARLNDSPEALAKMDDLCKRAQAWVIEAARAGNDNNLAGATEAVEKLRLFLQEIGHFFDEKTVHADIYFCPMHPTFVASKAETPCDRCGMTLVKRRIPYSFIYMKPGAPSVHMTATASGPVEAGKKMEVKIRLSRGDQSPVLADDLIVMHTQPIHLLIEDPGLGDYHHEHPLATGTPGEYAFSFTPAKTSPYRIWADIVPMVTGVQELPFADLSSSGAGSAVKDKGSTFTSTASGLTFALTLATGNNIAPRAEQVCSLNITVTGADGKPLTSLEPVMNAFAHLVGFYEDYSTVLHVHPGGGDVLTTEARGGPTMAFKFFPPKAGFIRFYCQVLVDGRMIFAPFNMNVQP